MEKIVRGLTSIEPTESKRNLVKFPQNCCHCCAFPDLIPASVSSSCIARSVVLRLSQPALLEPCARGRAANKSRLRLIRTSASSLPAPKGLQRTRLSYLLLGDRCSTLILGGRYKRGQDNKRSIGQGFSWTRTSTPRSPGP